MPSGASGRTVVPGKTSRPGAEGSGATGPVPPRDPRTAASGGREAPGPGAQLSAPRPAPGRARRRPVLTGGWWNTPRLVRALTALGLAALLSFAAATASVLAGARGGIDAIGHRTAPQAVRAADLYFALSDMDAQAANLLLIGSDTDYTTLRKQTLDTYEQRRNQAGSDLQRAAEASADDPAGQRAVQRVLSELGRYEALVARAQLLEDQAHAPAGQPAPDALETYRQATDLLRQSLLPAADEVTAGNAATVDRTYAAQRGDLAAGWWWLLATGLLALAALAALQRTLTVRFRRLVDPPLAAATLLTALSLACALILTNGAGHDLVVAKGNAYDSVIAISRARAVAYDLNADESRYLTDPARAAAYEQAFLDKTQAVARLDGATLSTYNARLATAADAHRTDHAVVRFDGFLGTELRNITFAGEQEAAERVLTAFQQYQLDDRRIRDLRNQGRLKEAVTFNTGTSPGQSNADFEVLGTALGDVLAVNQQALDRAITDADNELGTGAAATGGLAVLLVLLLTVLGVRPRLREYR